MESIIDPGPTEYWRIKCELAEKYIDEKYIDECPWDPDIYSEQLKAWRKWREFKKLPVPGRWDEEDLRGPDN